LDWGEHQNQQAIIQADQGIGMNSEQPISTDQHIFPDTLLWTMRINSCILFALYW